LLRCTSEIHDKETYEPNTFCATVITPSSLSNLAGLTGTVLLAVLLGCFGHSLVFVASMSAQHVMLLLLQDLTAQESQTDVWATLCATCIWRAFALAMSL